MGEYYGGAFLDADGTALIYPNFEFDDPVLTRVPLDGGPSEQLAVAPARTAAMSATRQLAFVLENQSDTVCLLALTVSQTRGSP